MEKEKFWIKPGHIDNIFKIYQNDQCDASGKKYICIKLLPEEKKCKSIN